MILKQSIHACVARFGRPVELNDWAPDPGEVRLGFDKPDLTGLGFDAHTLVGSPVSDSGIWLPTPVICC